MVTSAPWLAFALVLGPTPPPPAPLQYTVEFLRPETHLFTVTLRVPRLSAENDVFEFAATAPGTYQVMDIGRFVQSFAALDAGGRPLASSRIGTNRWRLEAPSRVRSIRYTIHTTRDTVMTEHTVYPMCGTLLRDDYGLINGQAVFGFPKGMQATPLAIRLRHPAGWVVGTALPFRDGAYRAESYDHLVDSPIMLGRLTTAHMTVTGVPVSVYTYSPNATVRSDQLLGSMEAMLRSTGAFLGKLPVDRYAFLFEFGPASAGAWEHSLSSEYVLKEGEFTPGFGAAVTDVAAHEFFHVVTPLNIHSEIIEYFNFETPVPSRHLWLYEGTTEWAAHKIQLESGLKPVDTYLQSVVQKLKQDRAGYDTTWSLSKLALTSFSDSGQRQYGNIYSRGAVVAGLLDIRLLELSEGRHGLRDLILDLAGRFGKHRAFPEDSLFEVIAARTGPAIGEFFARYVQAAEHLPVREYYAKLGITLEEDSLGAPVRFTLDSLPTPEQSRLRAAWLGQRRAAVP